MQHATRRMLYALPWLALLVLSAAEAQTDGLSSSSGEESESATATAVYGNVSHAYRYTWSVGPASTATYSSDCEADYGMSSSSTTSECWDFPDGTSWTHSAGGARSHTRTVHLNIYNDTVDEPDETIVVNFAARRGISIVNFVNRSYTYTIEDDDPTVVSLARVGSATAIDEGQKVEFTVTLGRALIAGETIDVPLSISGTNVTTGDWSLAEKSSGSLNTGVTLQDTSTATPKIRFSGAGAQTGTLELTATADGTSEGRETINVALGPDGAGANGFDHISLGTNVGGGADPHNTNNAFSVTVNEDNTAPRITSITRQTPSTSPTNADNLTWRVAFNEAVQNVDMADFSISGATATLAVAQVGVTNSYDVTASGGNLANLDATVTLSFANGQNIQDSIGNALANTTPTGVNHNSFLVDNTAPRITSITRQTPSTSPTNADILTWRVTFNEAVQNVDMADFSVSGATATLAVAQVGATNAYDVTASGGNLANLDATVTLSFANGQNIQDTAGNALANITSTGANHNSFLLDNTAPRITSITRQMPSSSPTNADSLVWRVLFDEAVQNVDAADFVTAGNGNPTLWAVVTQATRVGNTNAYDVTVSSDHPDLQGVGNLDVFNGTVTLSFVSSQDIEDSSGNALTNTTPTGTNHNTFVVDNTAPRVTSITRQTPSSSPTDADSLVWRVTFNEAVQNVNPADFQVSNTSATLAVARVGNTNAYDVTASGGNLANLDATVTLSFANGQNIQDSIGNALANTTPTGANHNSFLLDNTAPRITSITRQTPSSSPTAADSLTWRVAFNEAVQNVNAADFQVSGATATLAVAQVGVTNAYDVTASGGNLANLDATVTLSFANGQNIQDSIGNALVNITPTGANHNTFEVRNTPLHSRSDYAFISTYDDRPLERSEGAAGRAHFLVTRVRVPGENDDLATFEQIPDPWGFRLCFEGTATLGEDYTVFNRSNRPLSLDNDNCSPANSKNDGTGLAAGQDRAHFYIQVIDDAHEDSGETVVVRLDSPAGTSLYDFDSSFPGNPDGYSNAIREDCARGGPCPTDRLIFTILNHDGPPPAAGPYAGLVAKMYGWRNDSKWKSYKSHTDRWDRALLAFGESVEDASLTPMAAADAQVFADQGMGRWVEVAKALHEIEAVRAAVTQAPTMQVSNVQVAAVDHASTTVTWDAVEHATSYRVAYEGTASNPQNSVSGAVDGHTTTTWTFQHNAAEAMTLTVTVTPEYVDENGDTQHLAALEGTATIEVGPAGTGSVPQQSAGSQDACVPAGVRSDVERYAGETHYGSTHVTRWNKVLAAFGDDNGYTAMTLAGAKQMRDQYSASRWNPVVTTLQCLENAGPDSDPTDPEITVSGGSGITEGGNAVFTVEANPAPQSDLTVTINIDDDPTSDFLATGDEGSQTVVIQANQTSATLTLATENDSTDEPNGSVSATVANGTGYTVGSPSTATVAVSDDDDPPIITPTVSIVGGNGITEGGAASFTLTATPAPQSDITVQVAVADSGSFAESGQTGTKTVTIGATGTATLTVATADDSTDEPNGSVSATVASGTGYTVGSPSTATVAVNDDDDPPIITPTVSIVGGNGITEGGAASFTLTATPAPQSDITVQVAVADSGSFATSGQTGTKTVTIGATGTATLTVATADDDTDEADGSIAATIQPGNGYAVATSPDNDASVTVSDNDEPTVSITGGDGVTEGNPASFTVTANPAPHAALTVNLAVTQNGDYAASGETGTREVTIPTGGSTSFEVATADDNTDEADGSITAAIQTGSGYAVAISPDNGASVAVADNDAAPGVPSFSVDDAEANESDFMLRYTIRLSRASDRRVSVWVHTQESNPVSAQDGVDYVGMGWGTRIVFLPGETERQLGISLINDSHDEGAETFHVELLAPQGGATIADGVGVMTILNSDPLPAAWHLRFGRTVSQQVADALQDRLSSPAPLETGLQLTLAGEDFTSDTPLAENQGLLSKALGFDSVTPQLLVEGSSFSFAPEGEGGAPQFALWGQGALSSFSGEEDDVSLDGDVTTLLVGADWSTTRWQAGAALSHSWGSGSYDGEDNADGEISTSLTGLFPYGRYALTPRLGLWATAGYGWGQLSLKPDGNEKEYKPDTTMTMVALGMDGLLLDGGSEGISLNATADLLSLKTTSEEVEGLESSEGNVSRFRLGLEVTRPFPLANGSSLLPSMEVGIRQDSGDAETGFGMDLGAGMAWKDPEHGISGELKGRTLLSHAEEEFQDQGLALSFSWDPSPSNRGFSLSMGHAMGLSTEEGIDALLNPTVLDGLDGLDASPSNGQRFEAQLAYGFPFYNDRLTLTPAVVMAFSSTSRTYGLLWSVTPYSEQSHALPWELSIEAERLEHFSSSTPADHSLKLNFSSSF